jgi:hypothetical protein
MIVECWTIITASYGPRSLTHLDFEGRVVEAPVVDHRLDDRAPAGHHIPLARRIQHRHLARLLRHTTHTTPREPITPPQPSPNQPPQS